MVKDIRLSYVKECRRRGDCYMHHILLISDNKEVARLTSRMLKKNGYQVSIYSACDKLPDSSVSLLMFDCEISPKDGFREYYNVMRQYRSALILWVSSHADDEIEALEIGCDEWIKKPYNVQVFLARIKNLLRNS